MTRFCLLLTLLGAMAALWAAELPITDVVLFSSGVGYIQRAGTVKDDATVQLAFKPEQINDLLKSMVLLDLDGGKVGSVAYGAKDPISKTLQAFSINLNDNPTFAQLLNQLRGVKAEVITTAPIVGIILGVEQKEIAVGKDEKVITVDVLNLLTDKGFKAVRLDEITSLRLLDDRLQQELQDALKVLATGLDNQRKPVLLSFIGKGERRVVVGYLTETPIWKTSYRLVLGPKEQLLQGWAVVENTSDADWKNIHLSLLSGRPISFVQDLYTPLYIKRPVVRPQLFASLGPVQYDASLERDKDGAESAVPEEQVTQAGKRASAPMAATPPPGFSMNDGKAGMAGDDVSLFETAGTSVASAAAARNLGQAFEYAIKDPVTLPRQQSALIPIVTGPVAAWKLSIYNADVHASFPLYGLRVKNTTGVHLMGGPITVYDNDVYAGDATFEDLQPGEQRLVSYAVDLGVQGERQEKSGVQEIVAIKLVKGNLSITRKFRRTINYTFAIKDGKDRKLMVEHAYLQGWELVAPKVLDERTATLYRFLLPVTAKDGAKLEVAEERTDVQLTRVMDTDSGTLVAYMQNGVISPAVKEALQQVVEMQGKLRNLRGTRSQKEQEVNQISNDQNRIRQNMAGLDRTSDLYKRYIATLDEQETRLQNLRKEIAELQQQEEAQRKELEGYVARLDLT